MLFSLVSIPLVLVLVLAPVAVLAGFVVGWRVGHRRRLSPRSTALMQDALGGLARWTDQFAAGLASRQQRVEQLAHQLETALADGQGPRQEDARRLLAELAQANRQLEQELSQAERRLDHHVQQLVAYLSEAQTDGLTGLANRRVFDEQLVAQLAAARQSGTALAVLLADVDHFKHLNDRLGHVAGDTVLAGVAQTLAQSLRPIDTVARFGGDEFAGLLPGVSSAEAAEMAERLRQAVEAARWEWEGQTVRATVSCGAAEALPDDTPASLVDRADRALYAAKHAGRNQAFVHDGKAPRRAADSEAPR